MSHHPLNVLLAHDRWATEQVLHASATLGDGQLDRTFDVGHGSVRATLVHMLNVIDAWDAGIARRTADDPVDAGASVAALIAAHARYYDRLAESCRGAPDEVLHLSRGNVPMDAPRGAILTHVLTHGTHHRAQVLNMLRHLGVRPLPKSSVLEWMLATGVAQMG